MTGQDRPRGVLARLFGARSPETRLAPPIAPARWSRIERIFAAAVEAGEAWREIVERECAGDPELAREVESLFSAHASPGAADRLERELSDGAVGEAPSIGERVGQYELLERLGGGGMGVVYAARDERLGRTVALKVLPPVLSADPESTRRFLLEARSAAALDHPNICSIHEIGESEDGRLFLAMPLYRGEALDARIARGPIPVGDALGVAVEVARGLEHAHANGIVHRDVKPANLFLLEDGSVKVLDFGIAKVADVNLTHTGAILGTVPYMSPEQAGGGEVDHRTDLWSLGVVLHEMIAGRRPFEGTTMEATIAAILSQEPVPLAGAPGADAANRVLRRLLAKDPADRLPSAGAAIAALEAAREAVLHGPIWEGGEEGPPIAPDGERRQVAVLVARVGGYAELVERFAPDVLERAVERVREAAAGIAGRQGGVVHRFTGESLVCLFGVPTTHEDDIARAVRAARELRAWGAGPWAGEGDEAPALGLGFGVCAGVVVVQPDPATRSHRVAGDPLESASRLAAHAARDEILVGPECQRLLAARFELRPAAALTLRPGEEPATPHVVVAEAAAPASATAEPLGRAALTPFAGREQELAALRDALSLALASEGQFVTVEGEAGAGKSRLLHEWAASDLRAGAQTVRVWCRPQRMGASPYSPFVTVLRELLELGAGPAHALDPEAVARGVRARAPELADSLPLFLHLLGVSAERYALPRHLEGDRLRGAIRDAVAALLTLGTHVRPLALVLEDWHWADNASHEVLKQVAELAPAYRLAVVVSYRPDHGVEWPEATPRRAVRLGPLEPGATEVLIRAVLGAGTVPGEVAAAIHRRTGGNPFFVEELCHALREQGSAGVRGGRVELAGELDALHLPATIQGVIRTRLDRLDPEARDVARAASVAGRDFTDGLLRRLVGPGVALPRALDQLRAAGLIHRTRLVPEPAYRFKHALTQEVIYDTLLVHRRRALHAQVGRALESLHADRPSELADVLAYHFSRAESWREAVRHGREAARQAQALSEYPRALQVIEQAEAWAAKLAHDGERRDALIGILLEQERLCETLGMRRRQQDLIDRLLERLDPVRDGTQAAEVYRRQGDLYVVLRRYDDARVSLDRALELGREAGSRESERGALLSLGGLCWHAGRARDGIPFLEQALAIDRERGAVDDLARDLFNLATVYKELGDWERALAALDEAESAAKEDPVLTAYVLYNIAGLHRTRGEAERALAYLRRVLELDRAHGLVLEQMFVLSVIANIRLDRGEADEAVTHYREAIEIGRRVRHAEGLSLCLRSLGDVLVGFGRDVEALPYFEEAAELFATLQDRPSEADVRARIGELETRRGGHRAAAAAWLRVRELRAEAGDLAGELDAAAGAARALRETAGETASARALFQDALGVAERLGDRSKLGELYNAAGILEWRARDYERALDCYERALAIAREKGDPMQEGLALNSIGATLLCLRRLDEARARLEEAVALNRGNGQALLEGHALGLLGDAQLASGTCDEATRSYETSLAIRRRIRDRRGEGWMLHQLARAADIAEEHDRAEVLRAEARRIATEVGDDELEAACGVAASRDDDPASEPWESGGEHHA